MCQWYAFEMLSRIYLFLLLALLFSLSESLPLFSASYSLLLSRPLPALSLFLSLSLPHLSPRQVTCLVGSKQTWKIQKPNHPAHDAGLFFQRSSKEIRIFNSRNGRKPIKKDYYLLCWRSGLWWLIILMFPPTPPPSYVGRSRPPRILMHPQYCINFQ